MNQYTHTDDQSGTCPSPPTPTESFTYDADGNLTGDADYTYEWDAENRLVAVVPRVPNYVRRKYTFVYDYMGRRVRRTAQIYTGSAWVELPVDGDQKLVYDRWNVIQVLDANNGDAVVRTYTWGLDLSGLSGEGSVAGVHGAGGIGGLLAVEVPQTTGESRKYGYLYDGNGNVVQLVAYQNASETATLTTHHEYDAYGRTAYTVNYDDGSAAAANPFRFSTKWLEDQTSANGFLYYYGYRYYSPRLGRWISRDPIGEQAGPNINVFLRNNGISRIDPVGFDELCGPGCVWAGFPAGCLCEGPPPPPPPEKSWDFKGGVCGCRSCRRHAAIHMSDDSPHSWIECNDRQVFDFPAGHADDEHNAITTCSDLMFASPGTEILGSLPPDGVGPPGPIEAACASCDAIKACLKDETEAVNRECEYNPVSFNCIHGKNRILKRCGLTDMARRPGIVGRMPSDPFPPWEPKW